MFPDMNPVWFSGDANIQPTTKTSQTPPCLEHQGVMSQVSVFDAVPLVNVLGMVSSFRVALSLLVFWEDAKIGSVTWGMCH